MHFFLWALCFPAQADDTEITNALVPFVTRHEIAGAVTLVSSKDRILEIEAIGYADLSTHKKMTSDTPFWIASMGKPIAATALMMLVDEGRVHLNDPINKCLPGFQPTEMVLSPDKT